MVFLEIHIQCENNPSFPEQRWSMTWILTNMLPIGVEISDFKCLLSITLTSVYYLQVCLSNFRVVTGLEARGGRDVNKKKS